VLIFAKNHFTWLSLLTLAKVGFANQGLWKRLMLETLAFTLAVGAVLFVMYWLWMNDDGPGAKPREKFSLEDSPSDSEN